MGGSQVRQNCKVIPVRRMLKMAQKEGHLEYSNLKHPDLLALMRSLDRFESWVNDRLLIIASKWIDEHREEVTAGMSEADMNDMGVAIEAAYRMIEKSGWIAEREEDAETVEASEKTHNVTWVEQTAALVKAEKDLL